MIIEIKLLSNVKNTQKNTNNSNVIFFDICYLRISLFKIMLL